MRRDDSAAKMRRAVYQLRERLSARGARMIRIHSGALECDRGWLDLELAASGTLTCRFREWLFSARLDQLDGVAAVVMGESPADVGLEVESERR